MIITDSIYKKVVHYSKKIARRWDPQFVLDLQQDVFIRLHKSTDVVENESSYVYTTVLHRYLNSRIGAVRRSKAYVAWMAECQTSVAPDLSGEARLDLNKILESFADNPRQQATLAFMIKHPDMKVDYMGEAMGVNPETFKANVRHIKQKLKKEGWL